jgi:hypothetical protein
MKPIPALIVLVIDSEIFANFCIRTRNKRSLMRTGNRLEPRIPDHTINREKYGQRRGRGFDARANHIKTEQRADPAFVNLIAIFDMDEINPIETAWEMIANQNKGYQTMNLSSYPKGVVEFIRKGGEGGEAQVDVELRTMFPGIGGTVMTMGGVLTAFRKELGVLKGNAHTMFLRHMIIKKLDDYFYRSEASRAYLYPHIPRPLGSISENGDLDQGIQPIEAYMYQWVHGNEGFPWEVSGLNGNSSQVALADWDIFASKFHSAGINMSKDITDADDGRISKNIIHSFPYDIVDNRLSSIWRRIDFGMLSCPFDFDKLHRFMRDNRDSLVHILRSDRYEMMKLTVRYLNPDEEKLDLREIGKLEVFVGGYRTSSLYNYTKGAGPKGGATEFSIEQTLR